MKIYISVAVVCMGRVGRVRERGYRRLSVHSPDNLLMPRPVMAVSAVGAAAGAEEVRA